MYGVVSGTGGAGAGSFLQETNAVEIAKNARMIFFMGIFLILKGKYPIFFLIIKIILLSLRSQNIWQSKHSLNKTEQF